MDTKDVAVQCTITEGVEELLAANSALKQKLRMQRQKQVLTKEVRSLNSGGH